MPHIAEIGDRLAALGFEREGRFWTLPGRQPVLEAPASTLAFDPHGYSEVEFASGRSVLVQDVEEVLLLRLDEFVATGNADVLQQCLWLLGASGLDNERLRRRAQEQSLTPTLESRRARPESDRAGRQEPRALRDRRPREVAAPLAAQLRL